MLYYEFAVGKHSSEVPGSTTRKTMRKSAQAQRSFKSPSLSSATSTTAETGSASFRPMNMAAPTPIRGRDESILNFVRTMQTPREALWLEPIGNDGHGRLAVRPCFAVNDSA